MTYKEKVPQHNPGKYEYQGENAGPFDHSKYAQCDYLLISKDHCHTIIDCESRINIAENTRIPLYQNANGHETQQQKPTGEEKATEYSRWILEKQWETEEKEEAARNLVLEEYWVNNRKQPSTRPLINEMN